MITHQETDILECEVKWALGSIITNKASGGDGIPVELFPILIDDAVKVHSVQFSPVQSLSRVRLFETPGTAEREAFLSIINCRSLLKPMSIESVMRSNHLILCRPLFLLPSIFPSIRVFPNELGPPIRWPKYSSFEFQLQYQSFQ